MGLWLVLFLIVHLFTNSQAALMVGDDGAGFIKAANDIRHLPYLPFIEMTLLALPFAVHLIWGVQYALTAKFNSSPSDGTQPALPDLARNHAYTWQRITSWFLIILIAMHVIHMRYLEYPETAFKGSEKYYFVRLNDDPGLRGVANRFGLTLYNQEEVEREFQTEESAWKRALEAHALNPRQKLLITPDFGKAELLMVRDTFKRPEMLLLYTFLVLFACFHAFNGLWTFLIKWGVTLSVKSQRIARRVSSVLMILIAFLGLAAVWGTFWINLRQ